MIRKERDDSGIELLTREEQSNPSFCVVVHLKHTLLFTGKKRIDENFGKPKEKYNTARTLFAYSGRQWRIFSIALVFLCIALLGDLLIPRYLGNIVEAIASVPSHEDFDYHSAIPPLEFFLILLVSTVSGGIRTTLLSWAGERIAKSLRSDLFHALMNKDISFYDT